MQEYTNFTGMSPEQLIEEAEEEIEDRVKPRKQKIKRYIMEFREHLEKKGLAPLSIENRITGVRSFYKANDIIIPELERRESTARVLEAHKGVPTKDDIRKVLEIADPLEKAIILTGLSSGLSVNEICELKIEEFNNGYDQKTGITTLSLRREKKQVDFVTFLTPEASKAVLDYLSYRKRSPKNGKEAYAIPMRKQRIKTDENGKEIGYLFIKRSVDNKYTDLFIKQEVKNEHGEIEYIDVENKEFESDELRKFSEQAIQEMYRELCVSANLCADSGIWNLFRSHNMRKYFNNRLIAAKCDPMIKEFLMGHKIPNKTQAAYFVADPTELKEIYKDFISYLTIQKEADISESPEYLRIKQENQILQAETARHIVERSELQDLRSELEKLKASILENHALEEHFSRMYEESEIIKGNPATKPSAEYAIHLNKVNSDPAYKAQYDKFLVERFMRREVFGKLYHEFEVEKLYQKEEENKNELINTFNKLQNMKTD